MSIPADVAITASELKRLLKEVVTQAPIAKCEWFHHEKKYQHDYMIACPLEDRWRVLMEKIKEVVYK